MSSIFKLRKSSILALGSFASVIALMAGCGGGGGGSGSPSGTPSPFDSTSYQATYVPTETIPSDGKAPTGNIRVVNGRASGDFTFYLQTAVLTNFQPQIDKALRDNGASSDIRNNQLPASVPFSLVKNIDSSGKAVFSSTKFVKVCGTGTLTVDSTFVATGGATGTYKLTFPNNFTVTARGSNRVITLPTGQGNGKYCNNLPLREGSVTFSRPAPTATPIVTSTPTVG